MHVFLDLQQLTINVQYLFSQQCCQVFLAACHCCFQQANHDQLEQSLLSEVSSKLKRQIHWNITRAVALDVININFLITHSTMIYENITFLHALLLFGISYQTTLLTVILLTSLKRAETSCVCTRMSSTISRPTWLESEIDQWLTGIEDRSVHEICEV